MADRVTPWSDDCTISDRIDEIVATSTSVHIEMLDEQNAFMQIGGDRFAVFVKKSRLYIAWRESDLPPRSRQGEVDELATDRECPKGRDRHSRLLTHL